MRTRLSLVIMLALTLAGCATTRKVSEDVQIQEFKIEVGRLRDELRGKNEKIDFLERQLQAARSQKIIYAKESKEEEVAKLTPRNIQIALRNAGYYDGPIDGKIGKGTKKAIRDFQKANDLTADGIVGKQTWSKLKGYLQ